MRLSIYLLNNPKGPRATLKNFVLEQYNDQPVLAKSLTKLKISNYRKGLFFYQEIKKKQPEWVTNVNELLQKPLPNYEHNDIRGVLILQVNRRHFALSFNSGISMVKSEFIDYNFGFNVAKKILDEQKISGYYSTDFSEKIINTKRNSSSFIPTHVINDRKNLSIVNSISGNRPGDIKTQIIGKYNLVVDFKDNLGDNLISYLTDLSNIYFDKEKKSIPLLDTLSQIKNDELIDYLNTCLSDDILAWSEYISSKKGVCSIPVEYLNHIFLNINHDKEEGNFSRYSIDGLGYKDGGNFETINKYSYFERFCNQIKKKEKDINKEFILNKLKRDNIYAHYSENDIEKKKIGNIYNSLILTYSLPVNDSEKKAIMILGKWFYVNKNHFYDLESQINRYKDQYQEIKLPGFSKKDKTSAPLKIFLSEGVYNERVAKECNLKLLDKFAYRYPEDVKIAGFSANSSIEPCDLLKYDSVDNRLVMWHIKRGTSAQGISHLTTQAESSAALLFHKEHRQAFIAYINSTNDELEIPENIKPENITIVLGITSKKPNSSIRNIFSLLELNALSRCLTNLYSQGFNVSLNLIQDHT